MQLYSFCALATGTIGFLLALVQFILAIILDTGLDQLHSATGGSGQSYSDYCSNSTTTVTFIAKANLGNAPTMTTSSYSGTFMVAARTPSISETFEVSSTRSHNSKQSTSITTAIKPGSLRFRFRSSAIAFDASMPSVTATTTTGASASAKLFSRSLSDSCYSLRHGHGKSVQKLQNGYRYLIFESTWFTVVLLGHLIHWHLRSSKPAFQPDDEEILTLFLYCTYLLSLIFIFTAIGIGKAQSALSLWPFGLCRIPCVVLLVVLDWIAFLDISTGQEALQIGSVTFENLAAMFFRPRLGRNRRNRNEGANPETLEEERSTNAVRMFNPTRD